MEIAEWYEKVSPLDIFLKDSLDIEVTVEDYLCITEIPLSCAMSSTVELPRELNNN